MSLKSSAYNKTGDKRQWLKRFLDEETICWQWHMISSALNKIKSERLPWQCGDYWCLLFTSLLRWSSAVRGQGNQQQLATVFLTQFYLALKENVVSSFLQDDHGQLHFLTQWSSRTISSRHLLLLLRCFPVNKLILRILLLFYFILIQFIVRSFS